MGNRVVALPGCESLWQETLTMRDFDPAALAYERTRNARPAYGLTLVADYPLAGDVLESIDRLRQVCQRALGDRVEFYSDDHLHLTVYSLLRSRTMPLSDEELTVTWARWLPRLEEIAGGFSSLRVPLRGLSVTRSGAVLVCGRTTDGLGRLQRKVSRLPGVAPLRDIPPHITIGQLNQPCGTVEAFGEVMTALRCHAGDAVGTLRTARLRLLYYGSRLLDRVLRSAAIPLGQRSGLRKAAS